MQPYLTYEAFGAIGDGIHDDMPAIVKTHEEANRLDLAVKAKNGACYYISPKKATAVICTDPVPNSSLMTGTVRNCTLMYSTLPLKKKMCP